MSFSRPSAPCWCRFCIGLILGVVLAVSAGSSAPLWAQSTTEDSSPRPRPVLSEPLAPIIPTDIDTYWAADCLNGLAQRQLLPISESAQFNPDAPATWADLAELLNRGLSTEGAYSGAGAAETALGLPSPINVLYTYPERFYQPTRVITRAEAVTALAAKATLPYVPRSRDLLTAGLVDGHQVPGYGREGVAAALAAGVLVNYPEAQRFQGNQVITRGEIAALVCRVRPEQALQTTISPEWVASSPDLPEQSEPTSELRGVWLTNIDSDVLFSQNNLAAAVERLKAMNINTLYPVVWNFGYPQFPSATAERILGKKQRLWPGDNPEFEAAQGDRDMLQELIDLAHAEGMAVIPWFEFGFLAPAEYTLLERRPEWFTQRQDGSRTIQQGRETFTWMNPLHPRTQQLLLLLMQEVLDTYDVEGIQVDDHLGLPVDMGYDPYTITLYAQEHNGELPPEEPTEPEWMRWRAQKITEFMVKVRQLIDQRRPGALLSVSPNPYPFSYNRYLQDWPAWIDQGIVDELIIQVYRNDVDRFVWELNKPATAAARRQVPTSIGLLSGLRGRPTDIELLTSQLEAVRDRSYAGVSYFFYQSLWSPGQETLADRELQFRESFAQPATRP